MKTFTDNANRSWNISVTVDAIKRVRSLLDVDLMQAASGKLIQQLADNPVLLCDVIYCVIKPQADEREITDEQFGAAMAGDAIDQATSAFLEDLVNFFPSRKREMLQKVLVKLKNLEAIATEVVSKRLDSPELDRRLQETIAGGLSGNSPESSESTPQP